MEALNINKIKVVKQFCGPMERCGCVWWEYEVPRSPEGVSGPCLGRSGGTGRWARASGRNRAGGGTARALVGGHGTGGKKRERQKSVVSAFLYRVVNLRQLSTFWAMCTCYFDKNKSGI